LPKTGKKLPRYVSGHDYAVAIATALRTDLGATHQATKIMMRWTGASERTVKNWQAEVRGPAGTHLISLMAGSDAVLQAVLKLSQRELHMVVGRMRGLEAELIEGAEALLQVLRQRQQTGAR